MTGKIGIPAEVNLGKGREGKREGVLSPRLVHMWLGSAGKQKAQLGKERKRQKGHDMGQKHTNRPGEECASRGDVCDGTRFVGSKRKGKGALTRFEKAGPWAADDWFLIFPFHTFGTGAPAPCLSPPGRFIVW